VKRMEMDGLTDTLFGRFFACKKRLTERRGLKCDHFFSWKISLKEVITSFWVDDFIIKKKGMAAFEAFEYAVNIVKGIN